MSAKRYHKSEQCFDINATPTKFDQSTTITVNGSQVTYEGTWYVYYTIDVKPNTDYYVSWEIVYAEIAGRGSILIADSNGGAIVGQQNNPFAFNSGSNTSVRIQIYMAGSIRATLILDKIMINEGTAPQPWEPYDPEVWHDCAVKRYRIEHASGFYFENYKGLLCSADDTIPPGIWLVILGTATSNIIYSDPMFKNASKIIKLKKGKSYTLFLKNTTVPGYSDCNIGFLKNANDEVLLETAQLGLGEEVTTVYTPTEDEDTEVYFGISIPSGKEMKNADYYHYSIKPLQPEWEDTPEYVRQNGVWVEQT